MDTKSITERLGDALMSDTAKMVVNAIVCMVLLFLAIYVNTLFVVAFVIAHFASNYAEAAMETYEDKKGKITFRSPMVGVVVFIVLWFAGTELADRMANHHGGYIDFSIVCLVQPEICEKAYARVEAEKLMESEK